MAVKRDTLIRVTALGGVAFMAACNAGGDSGERTGKAAARDGTVNLSLMEQTSVCTGTAVQDIFRVTNNHTIPVRLSDISIKLWVNETTAKAVLASVSAKSGAAFDSAWIASQITGHRQALAATDTELSTGSNATVLALAKATRPIVAHHLDELLAAGGGSVGSVGAGTGGQAATGQAAPGLALTGIGVLLAAAAGADPDRCGNPGRTSSSATSLCKAAASAPPPRGTRRSPRPWRCGSSD